MDVIKIRLQAQRHSMTDPLDIPKYRNAAHCVYVMVQEEGVASLYRGVALTALRQGEGYKFLSPPHSLFLNRIFQLSHPQIPNQYHLFL